MRYTWPPGGRLWHLSEGSNPADRLCYLSPSNTLSLALYYFLSLSISLLSWEEKKDFTGAKYFEKKKKNLGVKYERTKKKERMQLLAVCQSAVAPFSLCLPLFLIIKRQWAHSRKGNKVIIKAYSSAESGTSPAYLRDPLQFNSSGQMRIRPRPPHNEAPSCHALSESAALSKHGSIIGSFFFTLTLFFFHQIR